ncbi:glycosyltransferase family 4 protein [Spirosoma luteolum]
MTILYLTFYFEPDLCAGSFRNTPLVDELARQLTPADTIHVVTTQPNRYQSFRATAPAVEDRSPAGGAQVWVDRVAVPAHSSGLLDQIRSFLVYYRAVYRLTRGGQYDRVIASSSRLFTAFLGARLARQTGALLLLDIRDLFRETILEVLTNPLLRLVLRPILWAVEQYTFGYAWHINLVSAGFRSYFNRFRLASYSFHTNGIDDAFLHMPPTPTRPPGNVRTILYAGNMGEGQGLHHIVPQAARRLGPGYRFVLIGDGGARARLLAAVDAEGVANVDVRPPVGRTELIAAYQTADYLFVHLNDLDAFRRVLPSKLFEYGATDKPILAGVAGYAAQFVKAQLPNTRLFSPGDVAGLVEQVQQTPYRCYPRTEFVARFQRKTIMAALARQLLRPLRSDVAHVQPATV